MLYQMTFQSQSIHHYEPNQECVFFQWARHFYEMPSYGVCYLTIYTRLKRFAFYIGKEVFSSKDCNPFLLMCPSLLCRNSKIKLPQVMLTFSLHNFPCIKYKEHSVFHLSLTIFPLVSFSYSTTKVISQTNVINSSYWYKIGAYLEHASYPST